MSEENKGIFLEVHEANDVLRCLDSYIIHIKVSHNQAPELADKMQRIIRERMKS